MEIINGVPNYLIQGHRFPEGVVIRGDENSSEDQVAVCICPEEAKRLVACWNLLKDLSTYEIESGMVEVTKCRDNDLVIPERFKKEPPKFENTPFVIIGDEITRNADYKPKGE